MLLQTETYSQNVSIIQPKFFYLFGSDIYLSNDKRLIICFLFFSFTQRTGQGRSEWSNKSERSTKLGVVWLFAYARLLQTSHNFSLHFSDSENSRKFVFSKNCLTISVYSRHPFSTLLQTINGFRISFLFWFRVICTKKQTLIGWKLRKLTYYPIREFVYLKSSKLHRIIKANSKSMYSTLNVLTLYKDKLLRTFQHIIDGECQSCQAATSIIVTGNI